MDLKLALQMSPNMELTTVSYDTYVAAVKELTTYKEQLEAICLEQSSVKDLFNYSAMIVGESSPLLSSLVEENERCGMEIAKLVSGMHFVFVPSDTVFMEGAGGGGDLGKVTQRCTRTFFKPKTFDIRRKK